MMAAATVMVYFVHFLSPSIALTRFIHKTQHIFEDIRVRNNNEYFSQYHSHHSLSTLLTIFFRCSSILFRFCLAAYTLSNKRLCANEFYKTFRAAYTNTLSNSPYPYISIHRQESVHSKWFTHIAHQNFLFFFFFSFRFFLVPLLLLLLFR